MSCDSPSARPPVAHFGHRLAAAIQAKRNPVVVGIDPRWDLLPPELADPRRQWSLEEKAAVVRQFCREILDVVAELVPAVKIQSAFFEVLGPAGTAVMAELISYARNLGIIVIIDVKRGDIGPTAEAYAEAFIGPNGEAPWPGDAVTVNPYLGSDTIEPFVRLAQQRGVEYLSWCTSNPGAPQFQDLRTENGQPVYRRVANWVQCEASKTAGTFGLGLVGAVVGATYPQQLEELRAVMPNAWLLVPGYGTQGATAQDVAFAFRPDGLGAIVNNSRGIIFAYRQPQYAELATRAGWQAAARQATEDMIRQLREFTPAGNL